MRLNPIQDNSKNKYHTGLVPAINNEEYLKPQKQKRRRTKRRTYEKWRNIH